MSDLPEGKRTLSLAELLQKAIASRLLDVHTAIPGRVQSYDASTQTADVQPLIKAKHRGEDSSLVTESLPVIPHVPVVFPGAGGMRITFPMQRGDTVLLVFSEASLDIWQNQGGGPVDPLDVRRFHLSDAIAIPGLHDDKTPWGHADAGVVTIGSDSAANSDFAALAAKCDERFQHLENALNTHQHVETGGSTNAPTPVPGVIPVEAPLPAGSGVVGSVASGTVKIRG